jgi:CIC family chloride channel protein
MTSVLMIFETTRDYSVIVPLMISNLVSLFISSRLQHRTIYDALSLQDGIHLPSAESLRESGHRQVSIAMIAATDLLTSELTVQEAMEKISISKFRAWPVVNKRGVVGVVSLLTLEKELALNATKPLSELVNSMVFPHVHADQSLDLALNRMGTEQLELLPVVNRANIHKLEGVITLSDVLNSYGVGKRGVD